VSAFPLTNAASADAAMPLTAVGGSFSVHVGSNDGRAGTGLAEIYDCTSSFVAGTPRLINISARATAGAGNILTGGFVINGQAAKTVLIRGIGPTLGDFGVPGVLSDPQIALYHGSTVVATNDNWYDAPNALRISDAAEAVSAFPLPTASRDAAILITLPPGGYSAQVNGVGNASGAALVEVYEVE
jgi:hypothetical protein